MARTKILVIEDLSSLAIAYAAHLEKAGYEAVIVENGEDALRALDRQGPFGAILLDLQLPDVDGLDLVKTHPEVLAACPVVVATADASLGRAIEAMRLGAFEFLVKPVAAKRLLAVVGSAVELGRTRPAAPAPVPSAKANERPGTFIGSSPAMREVYRQIECVAGSRATVFITGESGTGKEVCAEAIHRESGRGRGPFVAVNCGAIPENLLESELFGHLKGSFTGAVSDRMGAVQAAHKGTLFLDEICEMALPLQVKLLRFLQTGTVQRVGSNRVEEVDVRIVCATNRTPEREVAEGRFREDLYYRLAVVPLHMPPLRDRAGDVAELAEAFLQRFAAEERKSFQPLGPEHIAALDAYAWPGNVRELQNVIRRAAVLFEGPELPLRALPAVPPAATTTPAMAVAGTPAIAGALLQPAPAAADAAAPNRQLLATALAGLTLDEIERIAVDLAVEAAGGSLPAAARVLGVSPSTLYRKRERWLGIAQTA
ncbi:MAG TPA: sigma-54 dependent transcriptional regulator [Novosphingobium sp.]|nr:sigma-54 dependent transcriptional regulator [Novosphingobium sp.]